MDDFEQLLNKYLYNINCLMRNRTSNKVLYHLKQELSTLFSAMEMSGIIVSVSDRLLDRLGNVSDDYADKKMRDIFYEEFDNSFETNSKIASFSDDIHSVIGDGYVLDFHKQLSTEDVVLLTADFFEHYDKNIAEFLYKKIAENKILFLSNNDDVYAGMTFFIDSLKDSFIITSYDETVNSSSILAHEVIHAYVRQFEHDNFDDFSRKYINNFEEVYSKFIEYVFIDYLHDIRYNTKDIRALEVNGDMTLSCFLDEYNVFLLGLDAKELYKNNDLFFNFMDSEKYSYGQILGFYYFQKYLDNKETTKDNLLNLTINSGKFDKKYIFNNFGLKEEEVTNSKRLVKEIKRHFNY